ncbi:barstar family protein [Paenibacillus whitsoniae]|uniref:Barnase inhibitor n=1 Tax=Paenibacillus whitsoniae TaxID=2496558 RepID=A0A3S0A929_9BACL|nr:barstar family protein [Paenibacillus whitsoniae]RTE07022.1 barnase inhibitor [Paenibacillus whitsoniae]
MSKTFIIDGSKISNFEDFCREFSDAVLSGKHKWNGNLDAFNDILRGGFGDIEDDGTFSIFLKNSSKLKESLGYTETVKLLEERLLRCHPSNVPLVAEELRQAKNGIGPTIFDWLQEIISDHEHITIILD